MDRKNVRQGSVNRKMDADGAQIAAGDEGVQIQPRKKPCEDPDCDICKSWGSLSHFKHFVSVTENDPGSRNTA
ncbi:MAG: hypothetical protein AB7L09_22105 [Nitrospira sp.]